MATVAMIQAHADHVILPVRDTTPADAPRMRAAGLTWNPLMRRCVAGSRQRSDQLTR